MVRPRLQISTAIFAICIFLGAYSLFLRRSYRHAEIARLEHEYLDWDWNDTPDEVACQRPAGDVNTREPIPRVVHFILVAESGREAELEFYQYLAIKSALVRIQPDYVKVHTYALNKDNSWWQLVQHRVELVVHEPRETLETADGHIHKLRLPHQTDILRLEILHQEGGIYLDSDVYALQTFNSLLQSPKNILMGHEGGSRSGIGNAVIVARPGSTFIAKWLAEYERSFDNRPKMWNHHSVIVPAKLANEFPEEICTLSPSAFFWPNWSKKHIHSMHDPLPAGGMEVAELRQNMSLYHGAMYENQLAYHAWGNLARDRFLRQLNPESLVAVDSRLNILLREIYQANV
ncbi:hypothetical protein Q7P37_009593 [Cladosporium fusiforme]